MGQCNPDTIPPYINCPSNQSINASLTVCTFSIGTVSPASFGDNCGTPAITWVISGPTSNSGSGSVCCIPVFSGVNPITYYATDASGNVDSCTFNLTVYDTQAPTVTCPSNTTVSAESGSCTAQVNGINANGADNCSISSVNWTQSGATSGSGTGHASGTSFNLGTTLLTYTVFDPAGNSDSCTFSVTIFDGAPPVLTCPTTQTVFAGAQTCSKEVNAIGLLGAIDNCGPVQDTLWTVSGALSGNGSSDASGQHFPIGISTIQYLCSDILGNTDSCSFSVTVLDTTPPALSCPPAQSFATDSNACSYLVDSLPPLVHSDNCSLGDLTWTISGATTGGGVGNLAGIVLMIGSHSVLYTATDSSGNIRSCSFTVSVQDTQKPSLICPPDAVHSSDSGMCSAIITGITANASDNCGLISTNWTMSGSTTGSGTGDASGTAFNVGTTSLAYTVVDSSGNLATCSITVTVLDTTPPVAQCKDLTAYLDAGGHFILLPDSIDNGSVDACGLNSFEIDDSSFVCVDSGANVVTLIVQDSHGNEDSCVAIVTVLDTVSPTPVISQLGNEMCVTPPGLSYQWYLNGMAIAGATDSCFYSAQNGSYHVEVNYLTGCIQASNPLLFTHRVEPFANEITLYPNPTSNYLTLSLGQPLSKELEILMVNSIGQVQGVFSVGPGEAKTVLDVSELRPGVFFLSVREGEMIFYKRFVVQ